MAMTPVAAEMILMLMTSVMVMAMVSAVLVIAAPQAAEVQVRDLE